MAKPLSKSRRVEIEAQAWALSQQSWSQPRIARHLGVDQATVSRALAACRGRSIKRLDGDVMLWLVTMLEQLEHAADEAMQAWERSKKPKKKASRKSAGKMVATIDKDGKQTLIPAPDVNTTDIVEREGEPAYLTAFYAAIDRIRILLNLDQRTKPKPVDETSDLMTVRDALAEAEAADAAYMAENDAVPSPAPTEVSTP